VPLGDLSYGQWAAFLLILVRTAALILTLPFFSSQNLPPMVKAGFSLAMAVFLLPVVKLETAALPTEAMGFALLVGAEAMLGAIIGLAVRLIFTSVQIMGQLIGFQMGFAVANVFDPVSGGQVSVLAQFAFLTAMLTLFAVNGHYWFIKALADSFSLVPVGGMQLSQSLFQQLIAIAGEMFAMAVRLGAPVIAALLVTSVVMGILAKTVPQMNILMVGFPIKITVGLLFFGFTLVVIIPMLARVFHNLGPTLAGLLKAM